MKSVKLRWLGDQVLKVIVVLSVAWTFFSIIVNVKLHFAPASHANADSPIDAKVIQRPSLSPSLIYRELPGIQQSLMALTDSAVQPVRLAVVFQRDSTCFVELTYISDCGCPAEKLDRYEITRTAIDPLTGTILTRLREENLSAERLNRYFDGLTQIRRLQ